VLTNPEKIAKEEGNREGYRTLHRPARGRTCPIKTPSFRIIMNYWYLDTAICHTIYYIKSGLWGVCFTESL